MTEPTLVTDRLVWMGAAVALGILGNGSDALSCEVFVKLCGGLKIHPLENDGRQPPNLDLARAAGTAARQAAEFYTAYLVRAAGEYEVFQARLAPDLWDGRWDEALEENRPVHARIREIRRAIAKAEAGNVFADALLRRVDRVAERVDTVREVPFAEIMNGAFADWMQGMIDTEAPAFFRQGLRKGWAFRPKKSRKRITVYRVFCFFFHEQLKRDPEINAVIDAGSLKDIQDILGTWFKGTIAREELVGASRREMGPLGARLERMAERLDEIWASVGKCVDDHASMLALVGSGLARVAELRESVEALRGGWPLAFEHSTRATTLLSLGDLAGAERAVGRSITWNESQIRRHAASLASDYDTRARILSDRGDLAGAEREIGKSINCREAQSQRDERELANGYATRAKIRLDRGDLAGAEQDIGRAIEWGEADSPDDWLDSVLPDLTRMPDLSRWYSVRASILRARGDLAGAERDLGRSIECDEAQQLPRSGRSLAILYAERASILRERGDLAGAERDIGRAIAWGETQSPRAERWLAIWYAELASIQEARDDLS